MSLSRSIDNFFQQRKPSEKRLIYLTIIFGSLALSYQYLFPYSEKFLKQAKREKERIEEKINIDKSYIRSMTVNGDQFFYIKQYNRQLNELKKNFIAINDKKEYLDQKIKELSYLLYNKKRWAQFLNSLTQKAEKNGIEIDYIINNFMDVPKSFGHVLEVEIGCKGDFKNLIGYLNSIEQSDLVVDIYQMKMLGSDPIETTIKVSVWGLNY